MKILQLMAGARHGGAETAFADMCVALAEAGQDVTAVTRANPRNARLAAAGVRVYTLPFGGALDIYTPLRLRAVLRSVRPQIVQSWMARAAAHMPRWTPALGLERYVTVARLGGYYKLKHFRSSDYFTTITPDIRRYLIEAGIAPDRVRHINNFAETEPAAAPVSRAALDTPEDAPLALALGRLHRVKALDTLLRALAEAPGLYLWIAGEGPDRAALEKLCAALGLTDRVRFLGWRTDRAALFAAADVCVFPSRYEPFGTVFVQAWAHKTPLVCTAADGARQYVRDGEDGLMTPVDDVPALAAALRRVCADGALAARLAEKGYARYCEEFTKERTVAAYLDFYRAILRTK